MNRGLIKININKFGNFINKTLDKIYKEFGGNKRNFDYTNVKSVKVNHLKGVVKFFKDDTIKANFTTKMLKEILKLPGNILDININNNEIVFITDNNYGDFVPEGAKATDITDKWKSNFESNLSITDLTVC